MTDEELILTELTPEELAELDRELEEEMLEYERALREALERKKE